MVTSVQDEDVGELELTDALIAELNTGRQASLVMAEREQRLAAAIQGERRRLDFGEMKFQVHSRFYHYWGQRLGYQCWKDPQFVREFLRDNPECRIKNVSNKIRVGYTPTPDKVKFSKNYGADFAKASK